jgi:hypothetical protein
VSAPFISGMRIPSNFPFIAPLLTGMICTAFICVQLQRIIELLEKFWKLKMIEMKDVLDKEAGE